MLNRVFSRFDELARAHGLEKIKTIGDAYMAVAGLPTPREDHARAAAEMALAMRDEIGRVSDGKLALRIGLHAGVGAVVNVTLNSLFEAIQMPPLNTSGDGDDWKWVLRSASNRPILRFADQRQIGTRRA